MKLNCKIVEKVMNENYMKLMQFIGDKKNGAILIFLAQPYNEKQYKHIDEAKNCLVSVVSICVCMNNCNKYSMGSTICIK